LDIGLVKVGWKGINYLRNWLLDFWFGDLVEIAFLPFWFLRIFWKIGEDWVIGISVKVPNFKEEFNSWG